MNFLCELTIVIAQLPCLSSMAKTVSSTVDLVNSETSESVYLFNFAICAFTSKCFPIELVPCSDGWRRTWSHTIHMMAGMPVSLILQCKWNRHKGACLELFQPTCNFEPTFIQVHPAWNVMNKERMLNSRIKTYSLLEHIITSSNEAFEE